MTYYCGVRNEMSTLLRLNPMARPSIAGHLKRLSAEDRQLRFGSAKSDLQIDEFVSKLNFNRDILEGAFDGPRLVGLCNVSVFNNAKGFPCGDLGITVDADYRNRRLGAKLMSRAFAQTTARGVTQVYVHYLRRNFSMARLAASYQPASVEADGDEVTAILEPALREKPYPVTRTITADNFEVYECEGGDMGHVLFVHGAGGDAWQWRERLMPSLARQGIGSAALSLRNHGDTTAMWDGSLGTLDEDVANFVGAFGKPHSVLVGHSLGGYLAQHQLLREPERRAVMVNSVPPRSLHGADLDQAAQGLECHQARGVLRKAMEDARALDLGPVKSALVWIAGNQDRVIPKSWVRDSVRSRLSAASEQDRYVELPGGHAPMLGRNAALLSEQVVRAVAPRG